MTGFLSREIAFSNLNLMEFISDDVIKIFLEFLYFDNTESESAPQTRRVLVILDEYCQNGLKYDHLKTDNLPYNALSISPGPKHLEPDSNYSDLIGTMSAFN